MLNTSVGRTPKQGDDANCREPRGSGTEVVATPVPTGRGIDPDQRQEREIDRPGTDAQEEHYSADGVFIQRAGAALTAASTSANGGRVR